jgi:microcystin degradation protein MlrC
MRVAIGGLQHESAAFSRVPTTLGDFRIQEGEDLLAACRTSRSELGGAVRVLSEAGHAVVPTLLAGATPSGSVTGEAYRHSRDRLLARLVRQDTDGVVLALHGSLSVQGLEDAQADLLGHVREVVGPAVPIVVTFDLHASPSPTLLELADAFLSYRTAPHRDQWETGRRAAEVLLGILATGKRPGLVFSRLPLLLPGEFGQTERQPMASVMTMAQALEGAPGLDKVSVLQGYPWADSRYAGASILAVADSGHPAGALYAIKALAGAFWAVREAFYEALRVAPLEEALDWAADRLELDRPALTYLLDSGDNPTAGADTDDARILAALTAWGGAAVLAAVADPVIPGEAVRAGIGGRIAGILGGRFSQRPEVAVPIEGTVLAAANHPEGGTIVAIDTGCVTVMVSERRMGMRSPADLAALGIDPKRTDRVYVLKSGYLFPELQDMVAEVPNGASLLLGTPGASSLDLGSMPYRRVPRPIYPLDDDVSWPVEVWYRGSLPVGKLVRVSP